MELPDAAPGTPLKGATPAPITKPERVQIETVKGADPALKGADPAPSDLIEQSGTVYEQTPSATRGRAPPTRARENDPPPAWISTLSHDRRFPDVATLNGWRETVEDFARRHPVLELAFEAEQAFQWLQDDDNPKARKTKRVTTFFMNWLKREVANAAARSPSATTPRRSPARRDRSDFRGGWNDPPVATGEGT